MVYVNQSGDLPLAHEVITQLRLCGHFLHYKMGGNAGRRLLTTLLDHPEILQKDLQEMVDVQSGSLSEMVIGMEADGLVEKIKSEKDGRRMLVRLTPEGIIQAERCKRAYDRQVERLTTCFSEEQLREMNGLLTAMVAHWKEVEKDLEVCENSIKSETAIKAE